MEITKEGKLPFLNLLVCKKNARDLSYTVYRKPIAISTKRQSTILGKTEK